MEYQQIMNLLDNVSNQPSQLEKRVKINDNQLGKYKTKSQIKFKTIMLKQSSYDHSDAFIS